MALLSDNPVTGIVFDHVELGLYSMMEQPLRVFDRDLKSCNLEVGVLQQFSQFYVGR